MEASDNFFSNSAPWSDDMTDTEQNSREENRLLWELYDQVYPEARKKGIAVDWVGDDFDSVVIGNYEVSQGTFGTHDFKCLDIVPHGSGDLSRFGLFFEEVEQATAFFESHFNYLETLVVRVV